MGFHRRKLSVIKSNMSQILAKQVKRLSIIFSAIIVFGGTLVFASPPVRVPSCQILGTIKAPDVSFAEADPDQCLDLSKCPTDAPPPRPARYVLNIVVNSAKYVTGTTEFYTCERLFPVGEKREVYIPKDEVKYPSDFQFPQGVFDQTIEIITLDSWISPVVSYDIVAVNGQRYFQSLSFGMRNSAVEKLQRDLSQNPSLYPEKIITGYFGPLTQKAVQRFQCKHQIVCSGTTQTNGYGRVGPTTKAKLNALYSSQ